MAQSTVTESDAPEPPSARRSSPRVWWIAGTVAVVAVVAAIVIALVVSSSSPSSASSQVTTNWQTFFKGTTPTGTRVALLQNGSTLRAVLVTESTQGFTRGLSATVTHVQITSPTTATVSYKLLDSGTLLTTAQGQAIKIGGTWVVSTQSFCGLLSLQGKPPSICTTG